MGKQAPAEAVRLIEQSDLKVKAHQALADAVGADVQLAAAGNPPEPRRCALARGSSLGSTHRARPQARSR